MTTFFLVHGAGTGGWRWSRVRRALRERGHEALAPSLTGCGERSHLVSPDVDLSMHVTDVEQWLRYEDLTDVVLVGHSYGGSVIAGVAERCPERLRRLVFVDAPLPVDGKRIIDLFPPEFEARVRAEAEAFDGWRVPAFGAERYGHAMSDADTAWAAARKVPFPLACSLETVHLSNPEAARLPRAYIACTDKPHGDLWAPFADRARADGWTMREIHAGHHAPMTHPEQLADLLEEIS